MGEVDPGELVVWLATVEPPRASWLASLSDVEHERRASYRLTADRDRFVTGVLLARSLAARILGIEPVAVGLDRTCSACGRPHGKPRLDPEQYDASGRLELSISHAGDLVGLAATLGHPVGLDVEVVAAQGDPAGIASVALAPDERAAYDETPEADRAVALMRYWTRKEAVLKAIGTGLRIDPAAFVVTAPLQPAAVLGSRAAEIEPARVRLHDLVVPAGYVGSVAVIDAPPLRLVQRTI